MVGQPYSKNKSLGLEAEVLENAFQLIGELLQLRIRHHFGDGEAQPDQWIEDINFQVTAEPLLNVLDPKRSDPLRFEEFIIISLALLPHLRPGYLNGIISAVLTQAGDFPEMGGVRQKDQRDLFPTGETAIFLIAGTDLTRRFELLPLFNIDHWLYRESILRLEVHNQYQVRMTGRLLFDPDKIELLTSGKISRPAMSAHFPAQYISTQLDWNDLVLNQKTRDQIEELQRWIHHNHILMEDWQMSKRLKPGYRALFYGPPGTGKTLTATLLGKYTERDVFRIDLSMIISKFIGETEKNLSTLFDKAQNKNWILFFDEADALFGKRTNVRDAHDKYANQEVSYLLQRIENYPGLVILASNFKSNIDEAFSRRFQSIIHFPMPRANERQQLWQKAFPPKAELAPDIDFRHLARQYELTGSNIMNVVQYSCLFALEQPNHQIQLTYILDGIRKEFAKDGKIV